jgi:hypothetical protein
MIKSKRMKWAGHVARTRDLRNRSLYTILVGKTEWKGQLDKWFFPSGFRLTFCMHFSSQPYVLHALPVSAYGEWLIFGEGYK